MWYREDATVDLKRLSFVKTATVRDNDIRSLMRLYFEIALWSRCYRFGVGVSGFFFVWNNFIYLSLLLYIYLFTQSIYMDTLLWQIIFKLTQDIKIRCFFIRNTLLYCHNILHILRLSLEFVFKLNDCKIFIQIP